MCIDLRFAAKKMANVCTGIMGDAKLTFDECNLRSVAEQFRKIQKNP